MAHFALIDDPITVDGHAAHLVLRVDVLRDEDTQGSDGVEDEAVGAAYLRGLFGGTWVQCSYNASTRGAYPGPGSLWLPDLGVFVKERPKPSWTLDAAGVWQPPVAHPDPANYWDHSWDEEHQQWMNDALRMTALAWRRRFTREQEDAIWTSTDPTLQGFVAELERRTHVRLDSPTTNDGATYVSSWLEGQSLLPAGQTAADKKAELLAAPST